MADIVYNRGAYELGTGGTVWNSSTLKILLLQSSYSELRTHNFVSDIVASEISVGGYARQTLGSKTTTENDGSNRVEYDAADAVFTALAAGQTIGGAAVCRDTGSDATSPVLCFLDLTNTPTNGGDITVQFAASGVINLTT